jgi:hypothetical protein
MPGGLASYAGLMVAGGQLTWDSGVLIVPLTPGAHTVEVSTLPQPPVFRRWQMW